jgi:hypothetical protein
VIWPMKKPDADLENARPGKIGKQVPVGDQNSEQSHNIHNAPRGAQIVHNGVPVWVLVLCVLGASAPGYYALFGLLQLGIQTGAQIGTISATATNAKDISVMAERNVKLAQYQTEEAIKKWEEERKK